MHTSYSDGRAVAEDYIAPAIAAGLSEMGFSEHLTLFRGPLDWSMDSSLVNSYIEHIRELKESNKDIKIKIGLEVDFFPGKEEELKSFLDPLLLDYVIGSVHYMGEKTVDLGSEFYEGKNIDRLFEKYFEEVGAAAASGIFNIIAHCDLVRIFGYKPSSDQEPLYREIAKTMKKNNVAFEVNTNGRNRPVADFYPDRKYLNVFLEEKVPVCVNSDAHMPSRVAQYFDEAYELLRYCGFTEMAVFDRKNMRTVSF